MAVLARLPRLLLALSLLALSLSPALAVFGGKIAGGGDSVAKAVAAILYQDDTGAHLCTGVALAPRLVLTAAHCTAGDRDQIKVIFATELAGVGADRIRSVTTVAKAVDTPEAKGKFAYQNPDDIALILLDTAAPAGTAFASLANALPAGGRLVAAGYGATSDFRKPDAQGQHQLGFDRILRTATLPSASTDSALLVADQTQGAAVCTGDSGGPAFLPGGKLLVAGILIGVSSPRSSNDYCRGKAWYAAIPRWKPWLEAAASAFGQKL